MWLRYCPKKMRTLYKTKDFLCHHHQRGAQSSPNMKPRCTSKLPPPGMAIHSLCVPQVCGSPVPVHIIAVYSEKVHQPDGSIYQQPSRAVVPAACLPNPLPLEPLPFKDNNHKDRCKEDDSQEDGAEDGRPQGHRSCWMEKNAAFKTLAARSHSAPDTDWAKGPILPFPKLQPLRPWQLWL